MHVSKWISRLLAVLAGGILCGIGGLVCAVIGLLVGAEIGGNYAQDFVFNGMRGYEAGGQLGFLVGFVVGSIGTGVTLTVLVVTSAFLPKRPPK